MSAVIDGRLRQLAQLDVDYVRGLENETVLDIPRTFALEARGSTSGLAARLRS